MRFGKKFTVTLDVPDPMEFGTNVDRNVLLGIRQIYEGKCFRGCFIVNITSIERTSEIYINKTGTVGAGTIDVEFTADCSRFNKGDLYPGVRISRTSQVMMGKGVPPIGATEQLAVSIEDPNEVLADGFIIPVVIGEIDYPKGQSTPAASVHMLTCRQTPNVWLVTGGSVSKNIIDEMWARLEPVIKSRDAAEGDKDQSSLLKLFRMLLHSYSGGKAPAGPKTQKLESRDAIAEWAETLRPNTAWSRPITEDFDSTGVSSVEATEKVVQANAAVVFTAITNEIVTAAQFMVDAAHTYTDQALMKKQIGVWRVMRNAQIAAAE